MTEVEAPPRPPVDQLRNALTQMGVNTRKYYDREPVATLENFHPHPDSHALGAATAFVEAFRAGGRPSLYLFSQRPGERLAPGNGKTMLAVAILRELVAADLALTERMRFAYVPEVVDDYRRQFDEAARPENLDAKYLWRELLVLDDIGAQRLTDYAIEVLNRIIYRREGRSTIYTSNLDLEQLEQKDASGYIERATSRIGGECQVIVLRGPDRRLLRVT